MLRCLKKFCSTICELSWKQLGHLYGILFKFKQKCEDIFNHDYFKIWGGRNDYDHANCWTNIISSTSKRMIHFYGFNFFKTTFEYQISCYNNSSTKNKQNQHRLLSVLHKLLFSLKIHYFLFESMIIAGLECIRIEIKINWQIIINLQCWSNWPLYMSHIKTNTKVQLGFLKLFQEDNYGCKYYAVFWWYLIQFI